MFAEMRPSKTMQILWPGKQEKVRTGKTNQNWRRNWELFRASKRDSAPNLGLGELMKVWQRNLESHLEVPQVITEGAAPAGTHGRVM